MKTRPLPLLALVTGLAGCLLSNGCGHSSPPPRTTRVIHQPPIVVQAPAERQPVVVQSQQAPPPRLATPPAPLQTARSTPNPQRAPEAAPPGATTDGFAQIQVDSIADTLTAPSAEVLKMYESGVGDEVIAAYVKNTPEPFALNVDEIIYFTDLGLSDGILTAMMAQDQAMGLQTPDLGPSEPAAYDEPAANNQQPAAPVYAQSPPQAQPLVTQVSANVPATTQTVVVQERPAVTTQVFYDSLSPYGTWIYMDDYGWVWQPTVATVNVNWRPYYDSGRWAYTDAGWYWHSSYSWGWAPFHYGRWSLRSGYGWVWVPGSVWAPSWVSWRYTDAYCGWAPLPPYSGYSAGIGVTFRGSRVSVGFGFGLTHSHYAFVNRRHFGRGRRYRHGGDHHVGRNQSREIYNDSTVINNYIVGDNNTIVNEGIGRERIAAGNGEEIRRVRLDDVADSGRSADRGRRGNRDEAIPVYRPKVAKTEARPNDRQLARQETRATRKRIEERSGRSLAQEPTRRSPSGGGGGGGASLANRSSKDSSKGLIASNQSRRTSATSGLQRQAINNPTIGATRAPSRTSTRGTATSQRDRTIQRPTRPTTNSAKSSREGLSRSTTASSSRVAPTRNETRATRPSTSRSTIETRRDSSQSVSSRTRNTQRPSVSRSQPSTRATTPNRGLTRQSTTPTTRGSTSRVEPRSARTVTSPSTRSRTNPSSSRSGLTQRANTPSTRSPSATRSRQEVSRSTTRSQAAPTAPTYRNQPSTRTYQAPRTATPRTRTYQAPQRSTPSASIRRQAAPTPSVRRQAPTQPSRSRSYTPAPSRSSQTRSAAPSYSRSSPSRSTPSRATPSRSTSSRSSSSATRSSPQRSRGVPSR